MLILTDGVSGILSCAPNNNIKHNYISQENRKKTQRQFIEWKKKNRLSSGIITYTLCAGTKRAVAAAAATATRTLAKRSEKMLHT